ncbi:hypothetical protein Nepgr_016010 [Nepenthes gracilis]|uniref:Uncharacterized protein n=1 Tax=Nepenthes gracilis TaxID=150966 RepID=A0AAD3SNZ5_NEPGR|nr:hypothetical protein Nepgr_016010 [Nepenthes gracilis]
MSNVDSDHSLLLSHFATDLCYYFDLTRQQNQINTSYAELSSARAKMEESSSTDNEDLRNEPDENERTVVAAEEEKGIDEDDDGDELDDGDDNDDDIV